MVLRWFCSKEEEVVSRFVAIKIPCGPLWRVAKGTVRQCSLISSGGVPQQCLSKDLCCEFYLASCWPINGSFVRHGLGLPLVLKAKPIYSSKLEAPGFFKAWIWIRKEASRANILAKARRTCWHEDHTDTLSKQFTAAQSPWQCFWQERFFLSLRHTQCRLFLPIAFLHTPKKTQMTMIEHLHKLANAGIWRLLSCQPGDWSQKELPWQQI